MSSTASCQSAKSNSVGSSLGHFLVEQFTPNFQGCNSVGSILCPKAERMLERKIICSCNLTQFSRIRASLLWPCSMNTSIKNLSPGRGNWKEESAVWTLTPNLSSFSHNSSSMCALPGRRIADMSFAMAGMKRQAQAAGSCKNS